MSTRLLIVDDERALRELLGRHFQRLGYETELAPDGREALAVLARTRVDVIVTDIQMPRMDGLELLARLRADYATIPTVVMTGYVSLDSAMAAWRRGAVTLVVKPLADLRPLERAVASCVEHVQRWADLLLELRRLDPSAAA